MLVAVLATVAYTACEANENRTVETGTTVDQTSGTTGMSAEQKPAADQSVPKPVGAKTTTTTTTTKTTTSGTTSSSADLVPARDPIANEPVYEEPVLDESELAEEEAIVEDTRSAVTEPELESEIENDANFYEPKSRSQESGISSPTGEDRSHSQMLEMDKK